MSTARDRSVAKRLAARARRAYRARMEPEQPDPATRIDTALMRIDAAIAARGRATEALARRHAVLKSRMAEAVKALDDVIARESEG